MARTLYCMRGCGSIIHFDNETKSKTGKPIPLGEDNLPHDCPNSTYEKKPNSNFTTASSFYKNQNTDVSLVNISKKIDLLKITIDNLETKLDKFLNQNEQEEEEDEDNEDEGKDKKPSNEIKSRVDKYLNKEKYDQGDGVFDRHPSSR